MRATIQKDKFDKVWIFFNLTSIYCLLFFSSMITLLFLALFNASSGLDASMLLSHLVYSFEEISGHI